jgi:hypothetical protein
MTVADNTAFLEFAHRVAQLAGKSILPHFASRSTSRTREVPSATTR